MERPRRVEPPRGRARRRLGATSLALFGSLVRGEGSEGSDVDLLVELEPKTFDAYFESKRAAALAADPMFYQKLAGKRRSQLAS